MGTAWAVVEDTQEPRAGPETYERGRFASKVKSSYAGGGGPSNHSVGDTIPCLCHRPHAYKYLVTSAAVMGARSCCFRGGEAADHILFPNVCRACDLGRWKLSLSLLLSPAKTRETRSMLKKHIHKEPNVASSENTTQKNDTDKWGSGKKGAS